MDIAEIRMAGAAQDGGNFSDDEPYRPADVSLLKGEMLQIRSSCRSCALGLGSILATVRPITIESFHSVPTSLLL